MCIMGEPARELPPPPRVVEQPSMSSLLHPGQDKANRLFLYIVFKNRLVRSTTVRKCALPVFMSITGPRETHNHRDYVL